MRETLGPQMAVPTSAEPSVLDAFNMTRKAARSARLKGLTLIAIGRAPRTEITMRGTRNDRQSNRHEIHAALASSTSASWQHSVR